MSRTITEPAKQIDVIHETDVLVVGSGPGGLAAALAAARMGVKTTLVERFGCFGGNITTVGVEGFAWYRHEQTVEAGGLGREFEDRAKELRRVQTGRGPPNRRSGCYPDAAPFIRHANNGRGSRYGSYHRIQSGQRGLVGEGCD